MLIANVERSVQIKLKANLLFKSYEELNNRFTRNDWFTVVYAPTFPTSSNYIDKVLLRIIRFGSLIEVDDDILSQPIINFEVPAKDQIEIKSLLLKKYGMLGECLYLFLNKLIFRR